jgi:ankyrin repeat protein
VVGRGDDHALEVIGWATCFDRCHDDVAELLVSRGARHHIFSAIAMNLGDEVRRIVVAEPGALSRRLSRNEDHRPPLHHAVRMNRPEMVALLVELGADPLAVDGSGFTAVAYATSTDVDRPVMEALFSMTTAELTSAERGRRRPRGGALDLVAALALGLWDTAERLAREPAPGPLHLMAKRGDSAAARWLLAHGADPNARWRHWDADVTPLHLAAAHGHADVVRLLLDAGADRSIRDSKHGGNALDWAEHFQRPATVRELVRS